jgi:hypothetical protein
VSVILLAGKETLLLGERVIVARWSSLLLVAAVVGFCCRRLAIEGKVGLCAAERGKGEQKGVKICLAS